MSWSQIAELVGTVTVVLSLVYVGLQVRQNTAAIQTSTSMAAYEQNQEQSLLIMESADFASIFHRASLGEPLSSADSIRYRYYLNVRINLLEAVYTNALMGTMEREMADGWLKGMGRLGCMAGVASYWGRMRLEYHSEFRAAVDSAFAATPCPN